MISSYAKDKPHSHWDGVANSLTQYFFKRSFPGKICIGETLTYIHNMNFFKLRIFTLLFFTSVATFLAHSEDNNKSTYTISGTILSEADGLPISFAFIALEDLSINTVCDIDGKFTITKIPSGEHVIQISCLGFLSKSVKVHVEKEVEIKIRLSVSSMALPEFEVMAKKAKRDKLIVNQSAIEYIQPTSLNDVLLLLPGNVYTENSMTGFNQITSRQVGTDANTSLGVAVITDGAPVTNDAIRTQMIGVTENSSGYADREIKERTGMNQGVDMRYISTDHIQSVEFTRGISSARYGNLSSGMIQVNSKYGVSPLRIRAKTDLKNKLLYAGKGFKLSEKAGTLHIGFDYLNSIDDIREEMDKFTRLTGQLYYTNQLKIGDYTLGLDAKLNQTITVNKMKKDELTYEYNENYKADYSKTSLLLKGDLQVNRSWLEKLELIISSDLVFDKITRHRMVISTSGPMNVPLAKEEGEHEGIFLPGKYYSDFYIDNNPVNLFTQLNAISRKQLNETLRTNLFYGLEYRNSKNHGDGAVIEDETRPPFPYDNSYMRPRPNHEIPALSIGAAYLQAELIHHVNNHLLKLSLGGRITQMYNLPDDYALANKILAEPRLNALYTFGDKLKNTFRIGYGEENKLPTLDYLYPEKIYKDFYMLNAYSNQEEYRRLITHTKIFDVANKEIRENKNRKMEIGWDMEYKEFDISLTAFFEETNSGFEYFTIYTPLNYQLYRTLKPDADIKNRIPQKEDYIEEQYSIFTGSPQATNSKKVTKKGIEYRIIFPKIDPIYTHIELNGAYYKTNYGTNLHEYYYPNKMIANQVYPYIGMYKTYPENEYKRFNTNIWLNTHIPKFKLIFTNFVQLVWLSTKQYKDSRQKYPYEYMDLEGTIHNVTPEIVDQINSDDMIFQHMKYSRLPVKYARDSKPVSLLWNIKAMKEFNKYAKMAFFVNGIIDINPKYTAGDKSTEREWTDPYFGVELFLNF